MDLGPDNYRAYTNPIFCTAYDADVTVTNVDPATGTIPPGGMTVRFAFDISMDPGSYAIELKGLDMNGDSSGAATPGFTTLVPATGNGWADQVGLRDSVLTVTNQDPIPLGGDAYPVGGQVSFVVYWRDAPRDAAGNSLNPIAVTFSEQQYPGAGAAVSPGSGTTAPGATPGGTTTTTVRSSSGCQLSPRGEDSQDWSWLVMAGLALLLLGARRRA
jgi:MYXO-CTERM domain-containing protein